MTATINDCLIQLQSDLEAALVPAVAQKIYGYRTWPDKVQVAISLTYLGGRPFGRVTGGAGNYYDFAAVLGAQHDGSEASLAAAEQALNDAEYIILATLEPSRNEHWLKCEFPRDSIRPPSPPDLPETRWGEVYIRLYVR